MMRIVVDERQGRLAKRCSITGAGRNLPTLFRDVETGNVAQLTRPRMPVAVLLGLSQFEWLTSRQPTFEQAYRAFRESVDLSVLQIDPSEVFGDSRDASPGRNVQF